MKKTVSTILLLLALFFTSRCDNSQADAPSREPGSLVSATPTASYSYQQLQVYTDFFGLDDLTDLISHDVEVFKVVYRTTFNKSGITASGLLFVPQNLTAKAPIVSIHHGTTFRKDDVPSVSGVFSGVELFASAGYVAIMPDYLGYGESDEVFHPYYDREHSALAVTDMISATAEFLTVEGIPFDNRLFLTGYSEGGYVTMAAAQAIEAGALPDFTLTAVAAGAGGYDLPHMLKAIIEADEYDYPAYIAFLIMAYNNTYNWDLPLNYFFRDEHAAVLEAYMTGEYGDGAINPKLPSSIQQLLHPDFFAGLMDPEGEPEFKQALALNAVSNWRASAPIRLYHGTNDVVVPYSNSEKTLESMTQAGSSDVSLTSIPGGSHGSSLVPMLILAIPWFEELR